ncbi:MAG: Crp/Fnr family transcriptional regulator [Pseudomonadota bacterium]
MPSDDDRVRTIRGCYLFSGADDQSLAPLARASRIERMSRGTQIFSAGDPADGLRILLEGEIRIWLADAEGRELTLSFLGPGDPFGEIALLDGLPRTANATALEPTRLLFLPSAALESALASEPRLARHIILSLCELLRRKTEALSGFAFVALDSRLAGKLHALAFDHAEIDRGRARFSRRFSQTDLAHMLGVTREAVNKRFKALEHDGLVAIDGQYLVIPDLEALARRAETETGAIS